MKISDFIDPEAVSAVGKPVAALAVVTLMAVAGVGLVSKNPMTGIKAGVLPFTVMALLAQRRTRHTRDDVSAVPASEAKSESTRPDQISTQGNSSVMRMTTNFQHRYLTYSS